MLNVVAATGLDTEVRVLPATRAIVSWNTQEVVDTLELTIDTADGRRSRPLPYVAFEDGRRASLDGFDDVAKIETDIVHAPGQIAAIVIHAHRPPARVAVSVPRRPGTRVPKIVPRSTAGRRRFRNAPTDRSRTAGARRRCIR